MTRSETKLTVAIPAPVSGQSAVNVATATSVFDNFSSTIKMATLRQNGTMSQIHFKSISTGKPICYGINNETMTFSSTE